jgi:LysR family transcriptional activator of nhaA
MPAAVVDHLLRPALHLPEPTQLICRCDSLLPLIAELSINRLQLVLAMEPVDPTTLARIVCRPVLETAVVLRGRDDLIPRYRRGFPKSLDGAPLLWPDVESPFRRQLEAWFATHRIQPQRIAESNDPAFLESLANAGQGLLPGPLLETAPATRSMLGPLGSLPGLMFRSYALSRDEPIAPAALTAVLAAK